MGLSTYVDVVARQEAPGTLFNTYTTAKSVINAQALKTLDAGHWYVGRKARCQVAGALSNIVTTPGTVVFQLMQGTTAAPIVAWSSGNIQLNATSHVLLPFFLDISLTCRAVGATTAANLIGFGKLGGVHFTLTAGQVDAVNVPGLFMVPATAPAVGTGFDSSIANVLDFWVGFSINQPTNGVQIHDYCVEMLN